MSELSSMLEIISHTTKLHICVHDVSGVLSFDKLKIDHKNKTHFTPYCNNAKTTSRGYDLCIKCKNLANAKAINSKKPFCGYCPYGLFEAVCPVCIDGKVLCIVYAGNAILSSAIQHQCLSKVSKITKSDKAKLIALSESCEDNLSREDILKTAAVIADYIRLIINENKYHQNLKKNSFGWAVSGICDYIENHYNEKLTLKNFAKLYFMNEKYLGRLFKTQTGKGFNEYLNDIRLDKALIRIMSTKRSILEIALDCGYQSVNYFNRLFLEKYHSTPSEMRKTTKYS